MTLDCDEKYDDLQCSQISLMYRLVFLLMEIKCHLLFFGLEDINYKNFWMPLHVSFASYWVCWPVIEREFSHDFFCGIKLQLEVCKA